MTQSKQRIHTQHLFIINCGATCCIAFVFEKIFRVFEENTYQNKLQLKCKSHKLKIYSLSFINLNYNTQSP